MISRKLIIAYNQEEAHITKRNCALVTMSEFNEQTIRAVKTFLLKKDIISKITEENNDATFDQLNNICKNLLQPLKSDTIEIDGKTRLLVIDSLSIWMVRSSKIIQNKKIDCSNFINAMKNELFTLETCNIIFQYIIDFWLESSALANALSELLHKFSLLLKVTYSNEEYKSFLSAWVDQVLEIPSTLRIQYNLIEILASDLDMYHVLERKPSFIETSLNEMAKETLSNPIGKCLVSLLINIYENHFQDQVDGIPKWIQLWDEYALFYLQKHKFTKPITLYFLNPLFKNMPQEAFKRFIQVENLRKSPSLFLSLLKIGQQISIEEPFHDEKLISLELINELLDNNEYKLPTFEILTFSSKKSKVIQTYIFEIIKKHLRIFFVDVELESRNYFASSFKQFIIRIRDSAYALNRKLQKLQKANKFEHEQIEIKDILLEYQEFLHWVIEYLKGQMIPGIQYHRNSLALNILQVILKSGLDDRVPVEYLFPQERREYPFHISLNNDPVLFRLLVDNLSNHVPDIRQISKNLLLIFFKCDDSRSLFDSLDKSHMGEIILKNMTVYQNSDIAANLESFLFNIASDKFIYLTDVLEKLKSEMTKTKYNYIANADNNISSYLSCLSLILNEFPEANRNEERINKIVTQIWNIILEIWALVKVVLCHDATDGLLPQEYLNSGMSDQLVSSYAYRSVKEMSAVLNVLFEKYVLSETIITSIGDLLIDQLFSIRHSGAFQAILPCFRACCIRCSKDFRNQLDMWLELILDELEVKTQHITRRSGGLPFLVTTILQAEKGRDRPMLKRVFEKLFNIAKIDVENHQDKLDLPQINAFNCIKAIFVESGLSESCTPYIAPALELSFKYFTSDIWALRNCSLMLFTSLQNRIFGRSGKYLSARLFFTRYSGVKNTMIDILRYPTMSTESIEKSKIRYESILLVLNILLCLKSVPIYEDLDRILLKVESFLGDKNWQIRDMAARTVASLVHDPYLKSISLLESATLSSQNLLHGSLLTIFNIVNNSNLKHNSEDTADYTSLIELLFSKSDMLLTHNSCFQTGMLYLKIMNILLKENHDINDATLTEFFDSLRVYFLYHTSIYEVNGSKQLCLSNALEILLLHGEGEMVTKLYKYGLDSDYYEVQMVSLRYISNDSLFSEEYGSYKEEIINRLNQLLRDNNVLPAVKTLIVKALQNIKGGINLDITLDISKSTNGESTKLSAIESLGNVISETKFSNYWELVSPSFVDSSPEISRVSSLVSLSNVTKRFKNIDVLITLHKFLSDDDVDIREDAAKFINDEFLSKENELHSSVIATKFDGILSRYFNKSDVSETMTQQIKEFMNKFDFGKESNEEINNLFEVEKENQYRNDIEQITQYILLLTKNIEDKTPVEEMTEYYLKMVMKHITENGIKDNALGWLSNPDVFSRIIILRKLVKLYLPNQVTEFDLFLEHYNAHPIVFEYMFVDI